MDPDYKFNFDEMLDGQQPEISGTDKGNDSFASPSHVRNLCFVWSDGRKKFLNYAYLVSGEYDPNKSIITLTFTTETIAIIGIKLDFLFNELLSHLAKQIICVDARYNVINKNSDSVVNEIKVLKNE